MRFKIDPKSNIEYTLRDLKVTYVKEHRFAAPERQWRFDFAVVDKKIGIEYEGIFNTTKSRHTTVSGYTSDVEKYNNAVIHGWRVLRYTAKNYVDLRRDISKLLANP